MKQEAITIGKLKLIMDRDVGVSPIHKNKTPADQSPSKHPQLPSLQKNRSTDTSIKATITRSSKTRTNSFFGCLTYVFGPVLPSDGKRSDGRIASVVYLICLCAAGIVMNLAAWLQQDNEVLGITTDHIDGFLITCILPALVWIVYIFFHQNDRKTVDFISSEQHSNRPLMTGAYVFGTGSSVMDILHITYYLQCSLDLSSLCYSLFKSIFILTQILFLRKFSGAILHKSQSIRLVLFHILGTNVCMWFRALFSHADLMFKSRNLKLTKNFQCSVDAPEPILKIWTLSEPYLYPFTMEYSLIAAGLLYNMWSAMRDLNPDPQDIYIYDEMDHEHHYAEDHEDGADINKDHDGYGGDDSSGFYGSTYSPNLSRYPSHVSLYSRASNTSFNARSYCKETTIAEGHHHEIMDTYRPSADPGLLLGILLSILLSISVAFLVMDKHSNHALKIYYVYQIVLHTIIIIALWSILKGLQTQQSVWYPYNSDDTLLVLCFTGVFLYTGLALIAGISEADHVTNNLAILSSVKSALILLQSILQVTAIVKSARFQPSFNGSHVDIIRQGALFLVMTNFALWMQDSFFELRYNAAAPVQLKFFGESVWKSITIFAYPFCIFFRFHSAVCLFEVWTTFKHC